MKTYYSKALDRNVTIPERELEIHDKRFLLNLQPVNIDRFIADNGYDEQMIEDVNGLAVGESVVYGGGAAPLFELLRAN